MSKTKFALLSIGDMFVANESIFRKSPVEQFNGIAYNALDVRSGDAWLYEDEDEVMDVTTSLVK